jgi:hypothetical protein
MDELVLSGVRFPLSVGAFSEPLNCPLETRFEEEKYMDQPGAAPAAGVILDAAGNLYGTTVGGR